MPEPFPIKSLEIVGYADRPSDLMLPAVVPPVFRVKAAPHRILLPPYAIRSGQVCDALERTNDDLAVLEDAGEITMLAEPKDARIDHELWVGLDKAVHYEPIPEASAKLREIAVGHASRAAEALQADDLENAENLCRVALSADDRLMDPIAISAAITRRRGNKGDEKLMGKLAHGRLTPQGLEYLIDGYFRAIPERDVPPARDLFSEHQMRGMATIRAVA